MAPSDTRCYSQFPNNLKGMSMSNGVAVASRTYRKSVNKISQKFELEARHSRSPLRDLEAVLERVDEKHRGELRKVLVNFYKMGVKRGLIVATDLMAEGQFHQKDGYVYSPSEVKLNLKVRPGGSTEWTQVKFKVSSQDMGFA